MLNLSTLRPGLLVSLKTSVRGNVSYQKVDLENETVAGTSITRWETTRKIADAAEQERAIKVRSKASNLVKGVCARTSFGLLCPEDDQWKLEDAIVAAQTLVREFNSTAVYNRIDVYTIVGRIIPNDGEAVRAINSEIRELIDGMERGISARDIAVIRGAAAAAKNVGKMLSPAAQARFQEAIDSARAIANTLKQRAVEAVVEIDQQQLAALKRARTEFLDLEAAGTVEAPIAQVRAIDLEIEPAAGHPAAKSTASVEIE